MAIVINGSGTVTGLAVGGLPDGTVDAGTLATDSVVAAKLGTDAVTADALKSDAITALDLPAGSVLQVINKLDTNGGVGAGSDAQYYVNSSGAFVTSIASWDSLTTTQANSKLLFILNSSIYWTNGSINGNFGVSRANAYISVNSNMSSASTLRVSSVYMDARSTNGVSGQELQSISGTGLMSPNVAAGTAIYFTLGIDVEHAGVEEFSSMTIMEVAV